MAADIMLRSIIVVVAREPSIVLTQRRETRLKFVISPRISHNKAMQHLKEQVNVAD